VEDDPRPASVEPPRGTFQARVDEKGRLKLPAAFHKYLNDLGEQKVFITSLDTRTARIYPIAVWKDNEKLFDGNSADPDAAADVAWLANHFGADSEIDTQGRVLVPTELRRHLKIENEPVWLDCYRGRINLYSNAEYEQRRLRALDNIGDKLKTLERLGLK
jgi:MraZ protein